MSAILKWIKASFRVQSIKRNEVNFDCPFCGHPRFYFNYKKLIGFCHRASCGKKPRLKDLIDLKGYGPDDFYVDYEPDAEKPDIPRPPVELPGSWDALEDPFVIEALATRGVTTEHISKWGIRASNDRIYVPIVYNNQLVQYLGRSITRINSCPDEAFRTPHHSRYKYASGLPVSHFLFGWDEACHWRQVVLVENTFNAIAWRDSLNATTNFGSSLSKTQVDLLTHSDIKAVVFVWDKDASQKAWEASLSLHRQGFRKTGIVQLETYQQPDDVPYETLASTVQEVLDGLQSKNAPLHYGPLTRKI